MEAGSSPQLVSTDWLLSLAVAKFPDLTVEEAGEYLKILRERNPGRLNINLILDDGPEDILTGVEELWKNDLGAVGGRAGAGLVKCCISFSDVRSQPVREPTTDIL